MFSIMGIFVRRAKSVETCNILWEKKNTIRIDVKKKKHWTLVGEWNFEQIQYLDGWPPKAHNKVYEQEKKKSTK